MKLEYRAPACAALAVAVLLLGRATDAGSADSPSPDADTVTLDAATRARIGIATAPAKAVQYRAEARGLGQVMGLDALAQTDAELTGAEAAARASEAALVRARGLFDAETSVSRQSLEAAQHQATTDAAQLALARRKSIATWGHDAPLRDPQRRAALLAKISAGASAIVRATFPDDSRSESTGPMRLERLDGEHSHRSWNAVSAWRAPADPAVPGRSYFLLIKAAEGLAPGERVSVFAPVGASQAGALVPTAAVVIAGGDTWLYVEEKAGAFVRRAIPITQPMAEGYFSTAVRPGEPVVVQGAGQLLARETGTGTED
jgi:hypothetical protein